MEKTFYNGLEYETGAELCEKMAQECDTAILAFSTGKDSIAAWLQMRKYFKRIIPYYLYVVPELSFVEKSLAYYEDFFGCHIYRLPHPSMFRLFSSYVFQPPYRAHTIIEEVYMDQADYNEIVIGDMIRYGGELPDNAYIGTGVRMADSPYRRIAVKSHGAINHNAKKFFPVFDWLKADVIRAIDEAGIKLPVDYHLFGRTFDGLDYRFLKPIQEHYPEDYQKILRYFPFAELEIGRREGFDTIQRRRDEIDA